MGSVHSFSGNFGNFTDFFESATEHSPEMKMMHVTQIDVNGLGSTVYKPVPQPVNSIPARYDDDGTFDCKPPFVFFIHDAQLKEILFAGVYREQGHSA